MSLTLALRAPSRRFITPRHLSYGKGWSQEDMMKNDMLIQTCSQDTQLAPISKLQGHTYTPTTTIPIPLHRAFSLFLFNADNKMLITKRAGTKITFPNVWTNALCSHPLTGQDPEEHGSYPASISTTKLGLNRKLAHELGLPPFAVDDLHFATRAIYMAIDNDTLPGGSNNYYGESDKQHGGWGENEIDYIYLHKVAGDTVPFDLNAEEVDSIAWVTADELKSRMADPAHQWSPWFEGLMKARGWDWWKQVEAGTAIGMDDEIVDLEIKEAWRIPEQSERA